MCSFSMAEYVGISNRFIYKTHNYSAIQKYW